MEGSEASLPESALIQAGDGMLYGTTPYGGTSEGGTVFRMTPGGEVTVVATLRSADGLLPQAPLVAASDGNLYGTTSAGGPLGHGVVFRLRLHAPPLAPAIVLVGRAGGSSVRLTWAPVATGATYSVKRATIAGGETALASGITGTTFVDGATTIGRTYYYVISAVNASGEGVGSYEVSITPGRATSGDFDGDGRSDITFVHPPSGTWYVLRSGTTYTTATLTQWGNGLGKLVPGDYDGDGKIDPAVYFPSTAQWWMLYSSTSYTTNTGPV